jgi:hypothetical protein
LEGIAIEKAGYPACDPSNKLDVSKFFEGFIVKSEVGDIAKSVVFRGFMFLFEPYSYGPLPVLLGDLFRATSFYFTSLDKEILGWTTSISLIGPIDESGTAGKVDWPLLCLADC